MRKHVCDIKIGSTTGEAHNDILSNSSFSNSCSEIFYGSCSLRIFLLISKRKGQKIQNYIYHVLLLLLLLVLLGCPQN